MNARDALKIAINIFASDGDHRLTKECRREIVTGLREAEAEIERLERLYGGVKNDMRDAGKVIASQQAEIEQLRAVVDAAELMHEEMSDDEMADDEGFLHTNARWNWEACERSKHKCGACQFRDALAALERDEK